MTFSELIRSDKPVVVDFYADWCGPCRMMAPILEDVKRKVGERAAIYKVDVDRNPLIASAYNVRSIPTLIVFQKGKPLWRKTGIASAPELMQVLEPYFTKADNKVS
jgi:thioredoxin 1